MKMMKSQRMTRSSSYSSENSKRSSEEPQHRGCFVRHVQIRYPCPPLKRTRNERTVGSKGSAPSPRCLSEASPCLTTHYLFSSSVRTARWSTRRDPSLIQLCIPSGIANQYLKAGTWRPPFRHRGIDAPTRWQVGWAGGISANLTICSPGLTGALLFHRDFSRSDGRVR